ncbi:rus-a like endodeoxyribonuclease [Caudoviricetes sp.]|nr:rus-a like endodeoxyribonuclease [Caudoviricetes sp.]
MAEITVMLPWPDKLLSPNARTHWAKKAEAAKGYRQLSNVLTRRAMGGDALQGQAAHLDIVFHPPTHTRRDLDNCLSSIKSGLDGIADAIRMDDSRWSLGLSWGSVVKGGTVRITIMVSD